MKKAVIQGTDESPVDAIRALQRQRVIVLKSRIMQSNRLRAVVAGTIGYATNLSQKERMKKFAEAAEIIERVREGEDHPLAAVVRTSLVGIDAFESIKGDLEKRMIFHAKRLKVAPWILKPEQRGFGMLFLAIVVGETGGLDLYPNPAKVWKRLGCAPWTFSQKTLMGSTWRSGREGKLPAAEWEAFGYSPRRRSIAYLIGENLVKLNQTGPYRLRYDEAKALAKQNHPDWPDIRCHRHGMLLATKLLLKNLWIEWNSGSMWD